MIRVVSADDHALVRGGVKRLLESSGGIELVGEATNGVELMQVLRALTCDVLLLDITMPGNDGLSLLEEVRETWPGIAVLMLTMHPESQYAARALRAGARGYLTKDSAQELLIEAVRTVAAGRPYVQPALVQVMLDELAGENGMPAHKTLSSRELKVLVRIGEGRSIHEIAEELFLSASSVKTYRARVLAKLGLSTTAELIHYVANMPAP